MALFVFSLGSIIGWFMEIGFKYFSGQSLEKASMAKGPFCALYGTGAFLLYIFISKISANIFIIFISSAFFLTLLELIAGWILDKFFKITLWDYSNKKLNINKYICGEFMIFWGVIGIIFVKILMPIFLDIFTKIDTNFTLILLVAFVSIMAIDYLIVAVKRIRILKFQNI